MLSCQSVVQCTRFIHSERQIVCHGAERRILAGRGRRWNVDNAHLSAKRRDGGTWKGPHRPWCGIMQKAKI